MLTTAVQYMNSLISHVCQILAMIVIFIGVSKAMLIYIKDALVWKRSFRAFQESRLEIGHAFSLGLGFLIGASILKTTLAPTWTDIGQLTAIIAIRTALNYILSKEIERANAVRPNNEE